MFRAPVQSIEVERGIADMAKAIETNYKGYRFRSRLEARWAVFFDVLGVEYRYEIEGFNLEGACYLPDFWFPHSVKDFAKEGWGMWGEIKPREIEAAEYQKVVALVESTKHNALIFQGDPWPGNYSVTKISGTHFNPPKIFNNLVFCHDEENGIVGLRSDEISSYPTVFRGSLDSAFKQARAARFEHGETP
jgi:hypothetical protein